MTSSVASTNQTDFLKYSHTIGLCTMDGRGFMFPSDTAIGPKGRIYTVSRGLVGDSRTQRVTAYDLDSAFFGTFGSFGEDEGQFKLPSAIAVDGDGHVYVADEYTHRINIFDSEGKSVGRWGSKGVGEGQFNGPSGMAFDGEDHLYVSDHRNHRIQKFTKDGAFVLSFGSEGDGEGKLNLPWGVAVDGGDEVYIADWRNDRISKYSSDGKFLRAFGSSGNGDGQFNRPSSVAVDGEGYIYVSDWGNERVQVFGPDGDFITKLRGTATASRWAQDFLSTNAEEADARAKANLEPDLELFGGDPHEESAHTEKYFWGPVSVKLDAEGKIYVTESNRHRIQIYERGA